MLFHQKTYWSILETFLNNKKIPCIPPLFHENKFITGFKEKAELFKHFFVNQCSLLRNNSVLPTDLLQLTSKCLDSTHAEHVKKLKQKFRGYGIFSFPYDAPRHLSTDKIIEAVTVLI